MASTWSPSSFIRGLYSGGDEAVDADANKLAPPASESVLNDTPNKSRDNVDNEVNRVPKVSVHDHEGVLQAEWNFETSSKDKHGVADDRPSKLSVASIYPPSGLWESTTNDDRISVHTKSETASRRGEPEDYLPEHRFSLNDSQLDDNRGSISAKCGAEQYSAPVMTNANLSVPNSSSSRQHDTPDPNVVKEAVPFDQKSKLSATSVYPPSIMWENDSSDRNSDATGATNSSINRTEKTSKLSVISFISASIASARSRISAHRGEEEPSAKQENKHIDAPDHTIEDDDDDSKQSIVASLRSGISRISKSITSPSGDSTTEYIASLEGSTLLSLKSRLSNISKSVVSLGGKSKSSGTSELLDNEPSLALETIEEHSSRIGDDESIPKPDDSVTITATEEDEHSEVSDDYGVGDFSDASGGESDTGVPTHLKCICGYLKVLVHFQVAKSQIKLVVHSAHEIPPPSRGGTMRYQICITMFPEGSDRFRTKEYSITEESINEEFLFLQIPVSKCSDYAIRFRVYGNSRGRRQNLLGETVLPIESITRNVDTRCRLILEPCKKIKPPPKKAKNDVVDNDTVPIESGVDFSDDTPSILDGIMGSAELLLSLSYNVMTGRLRVNVLKATNLIIPGTTNRSADGMLRIAVFSNNGQKVTHSDSSIRRRQRNAVFGEVFVFSLAEFQLCDITLMVFVFHKPPISGKKMIGWASFGRNHSGDDQQRHWNDTIFQQGENVVRWHTLLAPSTYRKK